MSSPARETFHAFAAIGSSTERGGRVSRVTTSAHCEGHALARIGDFVLYKDGSEATIIDGAGVAATWEDKPLALVGSHLSNGDTIIESLQNKWGVVVRDDEPIRGLFDPDHIVQETAIDPRGSDA
ncbi:hypothetical protein AWB68_05773 [Caballeronia choica]|uniref:PAAR repeat-containing protein n=1 Tax=Caballeronia choica TaxID=326476 RepID=A0A158KGB6_9BURK|nr:PAAR domain-containing protein [Caballeronia choica]SAL80065.1 hypothetical protein AWB68_05773 [Caballeronia choica]